MSVHHLLNRVIEFFLQLFSFNNAVSLLFVSLVNKFLFQYKAVYLLFFHTFIHLDDNAFLSVGVKFDLLGLYKNYFFALQGMSFGVLFELYKPGDLVSYLEQTN